MYRYRYSHMSYIYSYIKNKPSRLRDFQNISRIKIFHIRHSVIIMSVHLKSQMTLFKVKFEVIKSRFKNVNYLFFSAASYSWMYCFMTYLWHIQKFVGNIILWNYYVRMRDKKSYYIHSEDDYLLFYFTR